MANAYVRTKINTLEISLLVVLGKMTEAGLTPPFSFDQIKNYSKRIIPWRKVLEALYGLDSLGYITVETDGNQIKVYPNENAVNELSQEEVFERMGNSGMKIPNYYSLSGFQEAKDNPRFQTSYYHASIDIPDLNTRNTEELKSKLRADIIDIGISSKKADRVIDDYFYGEGIPTTGRNRDTDIYNKDRHITRSRAWDNVYLLDKSHREALINLLDKFPENT